MKRDEKEQFFKDLNLKLKISGITGFALGFGILNLEFIPFTV
jgi:hypothetical protein